MRSGESRDLRILPVVVLIWGMALVGVGFLVIHAFMRELGEALWRRR